MVSTVDKQEQQGGVIGIVVHAIWFESMTSSLADKIAAERAQSFYMNWSVCSPVKQI